MHGPGLKRNGEWSFIRVITQRNTRKSHTIDQPNMFPGRVVLCYDPCGPTTST